MGIWIIKQLRTVLKAITSGQTPGQVALGFSIGALLGWAPSNVLYTVLIITLLILLDVNLGIGILAWLLINLVAFIIDPAAHQIGLFLLEKQSSLRPFWTLLSDLPVLPYLRFNNTVMLGSLIIGWLLMIPTYYLIKTLVIQYRKKLHPKLEKLKVIKLFKASKIVSIFQGKDG